MVSLLAGSGLTSSSSAAARSACKRATFKPAAALAPRASGAAAGVVAAQRHQQQQHQRPDVRARLFRFGDTKADEAYPLHDSRDSYTTNEVEDYFNYMGCLAVEGTYDRMEQLLASGLAPIDVLLLLAAAENDDNKIEELLACGADVTVVDNLGRRPRDLATKDAVLVMLDAAEKKVLKA